jgi:hypothetical protein
MIDYPTASCRSPQLMVEQWSATPLKVKWYLDCETPVSLPMMLKILQILKILLQNLIAKLLNTLQKHGKKAKQLSYIPGLTKWWDSSILDDDEWWW